MNESTGLLLGLCGLGIVCAGLLFVMLLVVLRVTGRSLPFVALLFRNRLDTDSPVAQVRLSRRPNLRARAEAAKQPLDPTAPAAAFPPAPPLSDVQSPTLSPPNRWRDR